MEENASPQPRVSRWVLRRHPDFARLWAAKAVSQVGDGAALIALVIYVQQTEGTVVAVSALLLAETLPNLLGPIAGTLADRVDQRRLMLVAESGQALIYGAIALLLPPFPILLVLVASASVLATAFSPVGRSAVPVLVPERDIVAANSLMGIAMALQGTAGPTVGGVLIAVAGVRGALVANGVTFLIAVAFLARLRSLPADVGGAGSPGLLRGTAEGIAFALRNRIARVLIVGLGLGVMFAAVDDVALVFLARDELGVGARLRRPGLDLWRRLRRRLDRLSTCSARASRDGLLGRPVPHRRGGAPHGPRTGLRRGGAHPGGRRLGERARRRGDRHAGATRDSSFPPGQGVRRGGGDDPSRGRDRPRAWRDRARPLLGPCHLRHRGIRGPIGDLADARPVQARHPRGAGPRFRCSVTRVVSTTRSARAGVSGRVVAASSGSV